MKFLSLILSLSVFVFAEDKLTISPYVALTGLVAMVILFFWGTYKTTKTQDKKYLFAMLPFVVLLIWMFFI